MKITVLFLCLIGLIAANQNVKDMPTLPPGGRNSVHGWLILPWDQDLPNQNDPAAPIKSWFVHHTPEFWTDSPHDFQIILQGSLVPMSTAENITYPIDLNYPPAAPLLVNEFTFTPPPPFSLNDLLNGNIKQLIGVVYNGSFDTSYERIALAIGTLTIEELTTAVYLDNSTSIQEFNSQRYFSYPRNPLNPQKGVQHYYMSHEIHAVPDFDQVIHVTIDLDACQCQSCSDDSFLDWINAPGAEWGFPNTSDDIDDRLMPSSEILKAQLLSVGGEVVCPVQVLEQIHCVVGPDFFNIC